MFASKPLPPRRVATRRWTRLARFSPVTRRLAAGIALLTSLLPSMASANTTQDVLGVGSRIKAMGGAGTAAAVDHSATFYNPANLAYCRTNSAALELQHLTYGLKVESDNEAIEGRDLEDRTAVTIGACLFLPFDVSLGIALEAGLQNPQTLYHKSLNSQPLFALYGQPMDQLTLTGALSYRVTDQIALGLGGAVLVNSWLDLRNSVPVVTEDEELTNEIAWQLNPTGALYAGITYRATENLRFGASYRGALYHKLEAYAYTTVEAAGIVLDVDFILEGAAWYSPQQVAVGGAYDIGPHASIAADVTWYNYANHPGPYLRATPIDDQDSIAADLTYPPVEEPNFRDIFVPRVGGEYFVMPELALRAGVAYKPTPAPRPKEDARANLLDESVTTVSLGAGWSFGGYPQGAQARDATATTPADGDPKPANGAVLDAHLRLHHMPDVTVDKRDPDLGDYRYTFGGVMFDVGLTLTVGWF